MSVSQIITHGLGTSVQAAKMLVTGGFENFLRDESITRSESSVLIDYGNNLSLLAFISREDGVGATLSTEAFIEVKTGNHANI